ncbi:MAG: hypothetical protein LLG20_01975 [Acidobacteriales bacterium]|nr:hypothetical protein [Terriglobales bacterium]
MGRDGRSPASQRRRTDLLGWWYVCIGGGFLLLGIRSLLYGQRFWLILLRWVIAAGFIFLGVNRLR